MLEYGGGDPLAAASWSRRPSRSSDATTRPGCSGPDTIPTVLQGPSGEAGAAPAPVALRNRHSGLCLDNYDWGTAPGAEVRRWTCNDNNAQQWSIT